MCRARQVRKLSNLLSSTILAYSIQVSQPTGLNQLPRLPELPDSQPVAQPNFVWGTRSASDFIENLNVAYQEVVHWKRNCFSIP